MFFEIVSFFVQCLIFYRQYYFVFANPMFGDSVRLAKRSEFPFVVGISRIDRECTLEENFFCSGVLVTKRDILTAAHCFENELPNQTVIYAGSIDLSKATRYYPLWWITYDDWAATMNIRFIRPKNDIGQIRLSSDVTHRMTPAALTILTNEQLYGKEVTIAAFGQQKNRKLSKKMKAVKLKILSNEECRVHVSSLHGQQLEIYHIDLCTRAYPPSLMFYGDSGAPVLHEGMIVGVHRATTPFPENPFDMRKLNIHTGINYCRNFIETVIQPHFNVN